MAKKKQNEQGKAAIKVAKKAKAVQKVERKEAKKIGKSQKDTANEEDLEAILENMRNVWEASHAVTVEIADGPPSRRANATLTPCPSGSYLWFIGGEFFSDDGKAICTRKGDDGPILINQTLTRTNRRQERVAKICLSDMPWSSISACGGEFSSLYQNSFHHYRDFWCLDLMNHVWNRIETKVRPSARSGCRMAMWKHYIFLFGGFYDPGIRTTYLDDLWYFDTQEYHWERIEFRDGERRPSRVAICGYCKEYAKGKRTVGIMLDDAWFLRISPVETEVAVPPIAGKSFVKDATRPFVIRWEKRKRFGYAPGPRVGCTMALWNTRGMGVLFGGVTDEDTNEETLESVYHNDLFGYQLSGNGRWVSLALRKPKSKGKKTSGRKDLRKATEVRGACGDNNSDNDADSDGEGKMTSSDKRDQNIENVPETSMNSENSEIDPDDPMLTVPRPRYNAMLAVLRNTLYIYGGILEIGPKEFTLDDFYFLSLDKLDRYVCIKLCEIDLPKEGEIIESSSDDEEDDSSDDNNTEDERDNEIKMKRSVPDERAEDKGDEERSSKYKKWVRRQVDSAGADSSEGKLVSEMMKAEAGALIGTSTSEPIEQSADDILSTPLPGETLAAFYARSRAYWTGKAHRTSDNRGKLLRRDGFALAQERYAMYKPMLEEVEKILAEAGLDESEIKRGAAAGPRLAQGESRNRR
ncbi:galactose oxidase [Sanghuangporus baumii]|uniref:Galactose oxidase n=1 Tax=Sanghuangporus baumii TaxID=108892 RepID=A0A9Q5N3U8_SANBA|nr:galactose oxidase [Sanghuangporus baumii]